MTKFMIRSLKYPRFAADCQEVMEMLGFHNANNKWPDEGLEPTLLQGILVWVEPKNQKTGLMRAMALCPVCEKVTAISRLPYHSCEKYQRSRAARLKKIYREHETHRMLVHEQDMLDQGEVK